MERWLGPALCLAIVAYCGAYLASEWSGAAEASRRRLNTAFRVALFVIVAAYLLSRLPVVEL